MCCSSLRDVEEELEHDAAVARPVLLGLADRVVPLLPQLAEIVGPARQPLCSEVLGVDPHDEHLLVVAAVPHADPAALGQRSCCTRHRKSWSSSSAVGALNANTWHPTGFTPDITARIVPSLPAASSAWNTSSTLYRSWAYSLLLELRELVDALLERLDVHLLARIVLGLGRGLLDLERVIERDEVRALDGVEQHRLGHRRGR